MAQQQQQGFSLRDEQIRAAQAAQQSDRDPYIGTDAEAAIYAFGVLTGQIDPGTPVVELQGKTIMLPDSGAKLVQS